jgi:hypothetical protein
MPTASFQQRVQVPAIGQAGGRAVEFALRASVSRIITCPKEPISFQNDYNQFEVFGRFVGALDWDRPFLCMKGETPSELKWR